MNTPRMIISTKLKVAELKQICAGMGICDGGTKKELLKRINEYINNYDSLTQSNSTNSQNMMETVPHVDPISLAENNEIMNEQDREYEEGLILDKVKQVNNLIEAGQEKEISISNLKTYLDYNNIDYKNVIEKSELLNLLPKKEIEEEFKEELEAEAADPGVEEDIQLTVEELRTARLKFFANKTI